MDLVNIVYRYVNRFINSENLIDFLENIDSSRFSEEENKQIDNLINEIKNIVETIPNELDEAEKKRIEMLDQMIQTFGNNLDDCKDSKAYDFISKKYNSLLREKEKVKDCGPRYEKIFDILVDFPLYSKYCMCMSDYELLEFITQYISVPLPPNISQEYFDDLVRLAIEKDERESLWRLAMNYNRKGKDFTGIENYFLDKRDAYYLVELVSAVKEDLNINRLIDKIINTNDIGFIKNIVDRTKNMRVFNDEEMKKLQAVWKICGFT